MLWGIAAGCDVAGPKPDVAAAGLVKSACGACSTHGFRGGAELVAGLTSV